MAGTTSNHLTFKVLALTFGAALAAMIVLSALLPQILFKSAERAHSGQGGQAFR